MTLLPIVRRSMSKAWLSNSYLVADRPGGHAVVIDTGAPMEPIASAIEELRLTLTHVLCTHHHLDHVAHNPAYSARFGCPVCAHSGEAEWLSDLDRILSDGEEVHAGDLVVRALHIPGHTRGQLAFVVNGACVFTGDTLFRGSVGGTRANGHTTFEDLQRSILDVLMALPKRTLVYPGHAGGTTIGEEWENNPFVRAWRGLDRSRPRRCSALGRPAELLLRARDYDAGTKCWVRWDDSGELAIVPGSSVEDC
jgi:glyoxylase-like metal-dependent hydrolase (beta-lactamase superfamily II)